MPDPSAEGWLLPKTSYNFTLVQNIMRDPFEAAVGPNQDSAMSIGGALAAPQTAFIYDWNLLPLGQQLALQFLETFAKYPRCKHPRPTI
jgi:arylsulfatase